MRKPKIRLVAAVTLGVAMAFLVPSISNRPLAVAAPEHAHGGEKHKLGKKMVGAVEVSVITVGEVEAGGHIDFDIKLFTKAEPKAVRVWIGSESGEGSTKAEGAKTVVANGILYRGEVTAPKPLPAGSMLWIEIEDASGTTKNSWSYDVHDHKH